MESDARSSHIWVNGSILSRLLNCLFGCSSFLCVADSFKRQRHQCELTNCRAYHDQQAHIVSVRPHLKGAVRGRSNGWARRGGRKNNYEEYLPFFHSVIVTFENSLPHVQFSPNTQEHIPTDCPHLVVSLMRDCWKSFSPLLTSIDDPALWHHVAVRTEMITVEEYTKCRKVLGQKGMKTLTDFLIVLMSLSLSALPHVSLKLQTRIKHGSDSDISLSLNYNSHCLLKSNYSNNRYLNSSNYSQQWGWEMCSSWHAICLKYWLYPRPGKDCPYTSPQYE